MKRLSIKLDDKSVKLMRGRTQIGSLGLDRYWQIIEVEIGTAATEEETERIIRLASSHAAQFLVSRSNQRAIPGSTPERSRALLDFGITPPQHGRLTVLQLETALHLLGIKVIRPKKPKDKAGK